MVAVVSVLASDHELETIYVRMEACGETFLQAQIACEFQEAASRGVERYRPADGFLVRGYLRPSTTTQRPVQPRPAPLRRVPYVITPVSIARRPCPDCGGTLELREGCAREIHANRRGCQRVA